MRWSFSRLSSFYDCAYAWKLIYIYIYIYCVKSEQNFFSQYGLLGHNLLENFANGKYNEYELSKKYNELFDIQITKKAPYIKNGDLRQKYYESGLYYFENFDFDLSNFEVLGVEKRVEFNINNKPFIGFIDLLLKGKSTGKIIVLDHKSSKYPLTKTGKISSSEKKKYELYKRQLYLYSMAIFDEYDVYPDELWWNYYRENNWLKLPFILNEYNEAKQWAVETINLISKEKKWLPKTDYYWCNNICSARNSGCEYKNVR